MTKPWKLATVGIVLTGVTALTTGLTTAWVMRSPDSLELPPEPSASIVTAARVPTARADAARTPAAPAPRVVSDSASGVPRPVVRPVSSAPAPTVAAPAPTTSAPECATGTDRAWRIAKPGIAGAVLGAGLGAAGGAIADGGKGAGKGALIGGLAGAVLGAGYGAYDTKNDCGTILGGGAGLSAGPPLPASGNADAAPQSALQPHASAGTQVYSVR